MPTDLTRCLRVFAPSAQPLFGESRIVDLPLAELTPGEVTIRVAYSSLNYKDALAVTGKGKIMRKLPLNAGIDAAGQVVQSSAPDIPVGLSVLITGSGLGEAQDGGYSSYVRVHQDQVIPLPEGMKLEEAMICGTAGFTAGLCLSRFRQNNQSPDMGPIVVTGASGGVGQFAVALFHQAGFEVIAVSSKPQMQDHLKKIGASKVIAPQDLDLGKGALESIRYGGIVDNLGGETLGKLVSHVNVWGNVGVIGLAKSAQLQLTVMPLILRGVSLIGISSTNCPRALRTEIWQYMARALSPEVYQAIHAETIALDQIVETSHRMLRRETAGRILVKL